MKKRILAIIVCLAMVFTGAATFAGQMTGLGVTAVAATEIPECDCGNDGIDVISHADSCAEKAYYMDICKNNTAKEIYAEWSNYPTDGQEYILKYLSWTNQTKLDQLNELIENGSSSEETGNKETTVDGTSISVDGNIPDGVSLKAEAVDASEYNADIYDYGKEENLLFAFDISLKKLLGTEWQPEDGETVTVTLDATAFGLEDGDRFCIVHEDDNGTLESLGNHSVKDGKITFETTGFSAFYGFTVDFEYGGEWYSMSGGSTMDLSELLAILGVDVAISEIKAVTFSDETLLTVEKYELPEDESEDYDWMLTSLEPFQTEEQLILTLWDGSEIIINVYDAINDATSLGTSMTISGEQTFDKEYVADQDCTITLKAGAVLRLKKTIYVKKGYTLTIKGTGEIRRVEGTDSADALQLFDVRAGGKLIIEGNSDSNRIVINGNISGKEWDTKAGREELGANGNQYNLGRNAYSTEEGNATNGRFIKLTGGDLSLKNVNIQNGIFKSGNGAAILANADGHTVNVTMDNVNVRNITAYNGTTIHFTGDSDYKKYTVNMTDCNFESCYNDGDNQYGGVIRTNGTTNCEMNLTRCTFRNNYAASAGGAILWNAGKGSSKATLTECTFIGNHADGRGGGAINCESVMEIVGCTFTSNSVRTDTDGITYSQVTEKDSNGNITKIIPKSAHYMHGTGVSYRIAGVEDNTLVEAEKRLGHGGALILMPYYEGAGGNYNDTVSIALGNSGDACTFTDNEAIYGGAVSTTTFQSQNTVKYKVTLNIGAKCNISSNSAIYGGGVSFYNPTQNYITKLDLKACTISSNKGVSGGGVYVTNTDVAFDGTNITGNEATNGAGMYMDQNLKKSDGSNRVTTVTSGSIMNNSATRFGGGIYQTGEAGECNVSGSGSVSNNTAANGGGIYVAGSSVLNVTGGIMTGNKATGTPTGKTTAKADTAECGVGGGVYVAANSTFNMSAASGSSVGLYGNTADFAAADAYASGSGTSLTLPNVYSMPLAGTDSAEAESWYEDYAEGDTGYPTGVANCTGRYHDEDLDKVAVNEPVNEAKYICLTLGLKYSGVGDLTITKKLNAPAEEDEQFIFTVVSASGAENFNMTVKVTVLKGEKEGSVTIHNLPGGNYVVSETNWNWRYDIDTNDTINKVVIIDSDNDEVTTTFNNSFDTDIWLDDDVYCRNLFNAVNNQ